MSFEQSTLPVSGSVFLVVAGYAALSVFVTGPMIGERTIDRDRWISRCETSIVQAARQDVPELQTPPPTLDCRTIIDGLPGRDKDAFCRIADIFLDNPLGHQIEEQNRKLIVAHKSRLADAAANANSRCSCSVNVVLQDRVPWAVYAGSLRLIKMSEIRNREARLTAALSAPVCAGIFDGRFQ